MPWLAVLVVGRSQAAFDATCALWQAMQAGYRRCLKSDERAADEQTGGRMVSAMAAATALATAVAVLNSVAGNYGRTVRLGPSVEDRATHAQMRELVRQMAAGEVAALLVHGPNPLYELPDTEEVADVGHDPLRGRLERLESAICVCRAWRSRRASTGAECTR